MYKINAILLLSFILSGCSGSSTELEFPILPTELQDCKFYTISDGKGTNVVVGRCPNSVTSVFDKVKKSVHTTVVY